MLRETITNMRNGGVEAKHTNFSQTRPTRTNPANRQSTGREVACRKLDKVLQQILGWCK